MRFLITLAVMLGAQSVHAGSKIIGNGGDVYVCGNEVMLLDFWEARVFRKYQLLDPLGSTYTEKLEVMLDRMATRFPHLTALIDSEVQFFEKYHVKIPDVDLKDIEDSGNK